MTPAAVVLPFGDSGVFVELGGEAGVDASRRVQAAARQIRTATEGEPGWGRPIPAGTSILVPVDPVEPGSMVAVERVRALLDRSGEPGGRSPGGRSPVDLRPAAEIEIPVRYGGIDGPDLETVAAMAGLSPAAVIELHGSTTYTALFLGFAPGFAYLGPLDPALVLPRRAEPRQRVAAGSVAIAGPQTAVYPAASPGGWWILGRTSTRVWDPTRNPAALIRAGDRVRFSADRG